MKHQIRLVVCDVDGTLTDGGIYISARGDEFKKFNAQDGMGMKILQAQGITTGIISASKTQEMVLRRAQMLGVEYCYVGEEAKLTVLQRWMEELGLGYHEIAYLGDDINDLEIMKVVGLSACPSDAVEKIKKTAHIVLEKKGGEGCFREFVDRLFPG